MSMNLKAFALLASLVPALSFAADDVVEVFKDKGDIFIRGGTNKGVKVGTEVTILGDRIGDTDEYRSGGKATVLEVWTSLARVSLDEDARKLKEIKYAKITKAAAAPKHANPANAPSTTAAAAAEAPKPVPTLKGRAELGGIGPAKRITLYNDSSFEWTQCDLRLPNNKHYTLGNLRSGDQDGILVSRFTQDGVQFDKPLDGLTVKCNEGTAKFVFSM
jgi:hypothetical protein